MNNGILTQTSFYGFSNELISIIQLRIGVDNKTYD